MFHKNFNLNYFAKLRSGFNYLVSNLPLNDPSTPNLTINTNIVNSGLLKYAVKNFSPNPKNTNELRALHCYASINMCIDAVQKLTTNPISKWAAVNILQVNTAAGADLNAYYDRKSLKFFYYNYKGKNYYFGDSVDIITHELGHAILDAIRPDFWSVQALEIWSFHEAFSDIVAVFNLLNHNSIITSVLNETNGNLRISNHASRLAEQVGKLIRDVSGDNTCLADALRDPAIEKFHYVKPSTLPKNAENNVLSAECHSFGRVFSAAWYEILVRTYELNVSKGKSPEESLKNANTTCFAIILKAIPGAPRVSNFYEAFARCAVSVASNYGMDQSNIFSNVFQEWNIIKNDSIKMLSSASWSSVVSKLNNKDSVIKTKNGSFVSLKNNQNFTVRGLPVVSAQSNQELKAEVASDQFYEFDINGNLIAEVMIDKNEIKNEVLNCMTYVSRELDKDGSWEIQENTIRRKLIR